MIYRFKYWYYFDINLYKTLKDMESQRKLIRSHLEGGESITPRQARIMYGSDRLGARIHELRHKYGLTIVTDYQREGKKRFACYTLKRQENDKQP